LLPITVSRTDNQQTFYNARRIDDVRPLVALRRERALFFSGACKAGGLKYASFEYRPARQYA